MSMIEASDTAGAVPHRPVAAARPVGDLMSQPVVTIGPGAPLTEASDAMVVAGVGSVVVVGSGLPGPIGIVTERDLVRAAAAGADVRVATVGEWMTATPDVVASGTSVDDALDRLAHRGYRHIPV